MARFRNRSIPSGFRRGPVRDTIWADVVPVLTTVTAVGGTLTNSGSAALLALAPFTIVRSRMTYQVTSDQIANTEDQVVAVGAAVVSVESVAIGVTAIPTPVTNADSDLWFLHQFLMGSFYVSSAIGTGNRASPAVNIDSKAMRKVEEGQDIVFVVEFSSVGEGARIISAGRILLKLH